MLRLPVASFRDCPSGYPFVGLLFTGFILTEAGPKVLEYNVRFGDPETEALMLLLEDDSLAQIMLVCQDAVPALYAISLMLGSGLR